MRVWVGSSFACYKCSCGEHSCPSPRGHEFSFLWDKCLGGEWPDHMEGVCSTFEKATKCFPECLNHFPLPSAEEEGPRGGWGLEPRLSPLQSLCPSLPGTQPSRTVCLSWPCAPGASGLQERDQPTAGGWAAISPSPPGIWLPFPAESCLPQPPTLCLLWPPWTTKLGTQRVPGRCRWAQEAMGWTSLGSCLWLCEGTWGLPGPLTKAPGWWGER